MSALPPIANIKQGKIDYTKVISQAAAAAGSAIKDQGKRLLTVDFPPLEGEIASRWSWSARM